MDKGIRPACNAAFLAALPNRVNSREGNTAFRKNIMAKVMDDFGATLASAATHYNHAFINAKELGKTDAAIAASLEGLGRPEDKKGGRKPKAKPAPDAGSREAVLANMQIALGVTGGSTETPEAPVDNVETVEQYKARMTAEVAAIPTEVTLHSVCKASDKTVVAEGLTLDEANALIAKAASAKKAKLEIAQ